MSDESAPVLRIRKLKKSFGDLQVLDEVDLDVAKGEVVTVIGPSGSGKTTLLRCVNFLEPYQSGSIKIDGREVGYLDEANKRPRGERELARIRSDIGMVFQSFNLFPHLSAAENVMLGPIKVRGKPRAEARGLAEHWLGRVGLSDKIDSLPAELSGGQQQRVGIARAVAMEPKIMLLDEITSALDPELVGEVLAVVKTLANEGMTMLVVTHEIAFARDAANRIVFMSDGKIAAEAPPDEFLRLSDEIPRLEAFLARFRATHF